MLKETDMRTAILAALDGGTAYAMRFDGDDIFTMTIGKCRLDYLTSKEYVFKYLIDEPQEAEADSVSFAPANDAAETAEDLPFAPDKSELESFEPVKLNHKGGRYPKVDAGKLMALHNAGWDEDKIADELKVTVQTVKRYLREEGAYDD